MPKEKRDAVAHGAPLDGPSQARLARLAHRYPSAPTSSPPVEGEPEEVEGRRPLAARLSFAPKCYKVNVHMRWAVLSLALGFAVSCGGITKQSPPTGDHPEDSGLPEVGWSRDANGAGDVVISGDTLETSDATASSGFIRCIDVQGLRGCCDNDTNYYFDNDRIVVAKCVSCAYRELSPGMFGYRCGGMGAPAADFVACGYNLRSEEACAALGHGERCSRVCSHNRSSASIKRAGRGSTARATSPGRCGV